MRPDDYRRNRAPRLPRSFREESTFYPPSSAFAIVIRVINNVKIHLYDTLRRQYEHYLQFWNSTRVFPRWFIHRNPFRKCIQVYSKSQDRTNVAFVLFRRVFGFVFGRLNETAIFLCIFCKSEFKYYLIWYIRRVSFISYSWFSQWMSIKFEFWHLKRKTGFITSIMIEDYHTRFYCQ